MGNLYNLNAWRKSRLWHLKMHPLCVKCKALGLTVAATVVDHIVPHKGDTTLFFDPENWQSLCKLCHDKAKQIEEKRGIEIGSNVLGEPIDPNHPWNTS